MPLTRSGDRVLLILCLGILLVVVAVAALSVGPSGFTLTDLADENAQTILWRIRLPRIILALSAGAALSVAGVALQSLLGNPLAEPFVLGVSGGGAVGALAGMSLGLAGVWDLPLLAALGGMMALAIVYALARTEGRIPSDRLILSGFVMNVFLGALITLLLVLRVNLLQSFTFWIMGSLATTDLRLALIVLGYTAIGGLIIFTCSHSLNALALGEETAQSLGVNVERTKILIASVAALLAGAVVASAGMIAFVGLIVPHICRRWVGSDARILLPVSALFGAIFLCLCDTAARMLLSPMEIPVGVLTAMIGGPFFFVVLRRGRGGVL